MSTPSRPFIQKPHFYKPELLFKINNHQIHYTDVLIYVSLRSFYNSSNFDCFPALETIAERAGVCKKFVIKAIKRLEKAQYISVYRSKKIKVVNKYFFRESFNYDRIPYDIFDCDDLTLYEKSMLLALRELTDVSTPVYFEGRMKDIASTLRMSYRTLDKQLKSLIAKGYVKRNSTRRFEFAKIKWMYNDFKGIKTQCNAQEKYEFTIV